MRTSSKTTKRKREPAPARAEAEAATEAREMIVLASHCSVKDAQALKASLCKHAREDAPVTVDVRAVERVDTATMQLLCAFVRERAARQQKVEWLGESRTLNEAARLLGLTSMLGLGAGQAAGGIA